MIGQRHIDVIGLQAGDNIGIRRSPYHAVRDTRQ